MWTCILISSITNTAYYRKCKTPTTEKSFFFFFFLTHHQKTHSNSHTSIIILTVTSSISLSFKFKTQRKIVWQVCDWILLFHHPVHVIVKVISPFSEWQHWTITRKTCFKCLIFYNDYKCLNIVKYHIHIIIIMLSSMIHPQRWTD